MEAIQQYAHQNRLRTKTLTLTAEAFEEERILAHLFKAIEFGGTVKIRHGDGSSIVFKLRAQRDTTS